jgi:hypothetical protein
MLSNHINLCYKNNKKFVQNPGKDKLYFNKRNSSDADYA